MPNAYRQLIGEAVSTEVLSKISQSVNTDLVFDTDAFREQVKGLSY